MSDKTKPELQAIVPEIITNRDPNPKHHVKTPEKADIVFRMAQLGLSKGSAAKFVGVSIATFEKYYREEYDNGVVDMQRDVAGMAFEAARAGSVPMLLHLVKTKLGWNEKSTVEHVGEVRAVVSNKPLSREEFVRRYIDKTNEAEEGSEESEEGS